MKSSAIDLNNVDLYAKLDSGFRLICDYLTQTDAILTRIDVKIENRQYSVALASCYPIEPKNGQKISPLDDLISPKNAVESCLNIKVNKKELIRVLKELLTDLESDPE